MEIAGIRKASSFFLFYVLKGAISHATMKVESYVL